MADPNDSAKSIMDAIYKRHAVRTYRPDKIESEAVRKLLHAAVRAPTAIHLEPWAFVVIQDRSLLKRLSDRAKVLASRDAERAPTAAQAHLDHPDSSRRPELQHLLRRRHANRHLRQADGTVRGRGLLVGGREPHARRLWLRSRELSDRIRGGNAERPRGEGHAGHSA